ncbi:MAG: DUF4349 domain-containing protein [Dehalococcoidia bacterium]
MKKLVLGILIILLLLGVGACGAGEGDPLIFYQSIGTSGDESDAIRHSYGLEEGSSSPFLDLNGNNADEGPPPGFYAGSAPTTTTATVTQTAIPQPGAPEPQEIALDRMIIRTGYMTIVVEDVTQSMEQIASLASTFDGYVVDSRSQQDGDRMVGVISIRVDANFFNDAIQALRNMAVEVTSESTSGEDVTEEYIDLQARLSNLEASEAQLLELMQQAGTVEEILKVQRELTNTREEIEQIKGRMQYLEQSSATSLIQVSLVHSQLSVEFTANTKVIKEGDKVWFRPELSGGFEPYSYQWDFGDGDTSTEEFPGHEYNNDDSFTVTLTVIDDRGNTDTYERMNYITVLPGWDIGSVADSVWHGLINFGRVLVNILIGIGIFSPVWIVILIILYFAWWRRRKKSRQKADEKSPPGPSHQ